MYKRQDEQPEKGTIRAVATGAVALSSGALPGRRPIDDETATELARERGADNAPTAIGSFWVANTAGTKPRQPGAVHAFDRWGDPVVDANGEVLFDPDPDSITGAVERLTRYRGPITVEPTIWVLAGNHVTAIESGERAKTAGELTSGRLGSPANGHDGVPGAGDGRPRVAVIVGSA